ncbi:MAG: hypothetical protein OEY67_08155 [Gammaproteobacteria bacterium]|nr:hypothetical protein [Gammaproteobacteria bacterium]
MADIRKDMTENGMERDEAMRSLRKAMRQKNECLSDGAHCDNARRAIINSLNPVIKLDPPYFKSFFRSHQQFASSFNDYKYVEKLCSLVCAIESWVTGPVDYKGPESDDPYASIAWIGGLDLHVHASMYFGFGKQEMLQVFQIVQEMKEYELDALLVDDYVFPDIEILDSEAWMLYFTAAVSMKFKEGVKALEARRADYGISEELRNDIMGAIKSTYWWKYMLMSRVIESSAAGLPPEIKSRMEQAEEDLIEA